MSEIIEGLILLDNRSMFTKREIEYFANLGEMIGYFFVEDYKKQGLTNRENSFDDDLMHNWIMCYEESEIGFLYIYSTGL